MDLRQKVGKEATRIVTDLPQKVFFYEGTFRILKPQFWEEFLESNFTDQVFGIFSSTFMENEGTAVW